MALKLWASSTANALKLSCSGSRAPFPSISRCFSSVMVEWHMSGFVGLVVPKIRDSAPLCTVHYDGWVGPKKHVGLGLCGRIYSEGYEIVLGSPFRISFSGHRCKDAVWESLRHRRTVGCAKTLLMEMMTSAIKDIMYGTKQLLYQ